MPVTYGFFVKVADLGIKAIEQQTSQELAESTAQALQQLLDEIRQEERTTKTKIDIVGYQLTPIQNRLVASFLLRRERPKQSRPK